MNPILNYSTFDYKKPSVRDEDISLAKYDTSFRCINFENNMINDFFFDKVKLGIVLFSK